MYSHGGGSTAKRGLGLVLLRMWHRGGEGMGSTAKLCGQTQDYSSGEGGKQQGCDLYGKHQRKAAGGSYLQTLPSHRVIKVGTDL